MTPKLNSAKATDRVAALKEIMASSYSCQDKEHITGAVIECLNDNSITVARQAVQTLARLGLAYVPDELKVLAHSVEDAKLKTLSIAAIARIELEQKRQETGLIEWNMDEYVFSVGDFLVFVNALLSHEIVHIKGEVFDVRVFRDNLVFFSLKDTEGVVNCWFPRAFQYHCGVEL